jgi:hypothetical protein
MKCSKMDELEKPQPAEAYPAQDQQDRLFDDPRRHKLLAEYESNKSTGSKTHLTHLGNFAMFVFQNGRPARVWTASAPDSNEILGLGIDYHSPHGPCSCIYKDADVLLLTEEEHSVWASRNQPLRMVIVRDQNFTGRRPVKTMETWISEMSRIPKSRNPAIDVQCLGREDIEPAAKSLPLHDTLQRLKQSNDDKPISDDKAPINLLNIADNVPGHWPKGLAKHYPLLFEAIAYCDGTIYRTLNEQANLASKEQGVGKPTLMAFSPTDIQKCAQFRILAQRGAVSGWHMDNCGVYTFIVLEGNSNNPDEKDEDVVKYWPVYPMYLLDKISYNTARGEFAKYGVQWRPRTDIQIPIISLVRGDMLIQPPGTIHAPITLTDCFFLGGMCWKKETLSRTLSVWDYLISNPICTNEDLPRQTQMIIDYLRSAVHEAPEEFNLRTDSLAQFDAICDRIYGRVVSCRCKSGCSVSKGCSCLSQGLKCGIYCHSGISHNTCMAGMDVGEEKPVLNKPPTKTPRKSLGQAKDEEEYSPENKRKRAIKNDKKNLSSLTMASDTESADTPDSAKPGPSKRKRVSAVKIISNDNEEDASGNGIGAKLADAKKNETKKRSSTISACNMVDINAADSPKPGPSKKKRISSAKTNGVGEEDGASGNGLVPIPDPAKKTDSKIRPSASAGELAILDIPNSAKSGPSKRKRVSLVTVTYEEHEDDSDYDGDERTAKLLSTSKKSVKPAAKKTGTAASKIMVSKDKATSSKATMLKASEAEVPSATGPVASSEDIIPTNEIMDAELARSMALGLRRNGSKHGTVSATASASTSRRASLADGVDLGSLPQLDQRQRSPSLRAEDALAAMRASIPRDIPLSMNRDSASHEALMSREVSQPTSYDYDPGKSMTSKTPKVDIFGQVPEALKEIPKILPQHTAALSNIPFQAVAQFQQESSKYYAGFWAGHDLGAPKPPEPANVSQSSSSIMTTGRVETEQTTVTESADHMPEHSNLAEVDEPATPGHVMTPAHQLEAAAGDAFGYVVTPGRGINFPLYDVRHGTPLGPIASPAHTPYDWGKGSNEVLDAHGLTPNAYIGDEENEASREHMEDEVALINTDTPIKINGVAA